MKHGLLALVLMLLTPPAVAAEPVGRLFYTPEQRSSLDAARSKRARNVVASEKSDEAPPPPPPTSEVVTYGGMVRRSDGKTTVWLNNRAVTGKEASEAKMVGKIRPDGTVTLQSPQTGRNVDLRVGQRAELLSGRVEEGYRYAPPPPKPELVMPEKPSAETPASAAAERRKEERERQENLDDALRALRDAAQARSSGTTPPQQPDTTQAPAPMIQAPTPVLVPGQPSAQAPAPPYK